MNTKCYSESVKRKYLLNFVTHILWHYTVFVSLGNCPHPRSEEVHRLFSSPEFKKPLSRRRSSLWWSCKALIWGYGLRSRDRVTIATLSWWGRSSSSSPSSSQCPRAQNGSPWLQVISPPDWSMRSFFFKSKQYSRPASAAMICSSTNVKAFTSASLKLVILVGAEKWSEFCKRTTNRPT